MPTASILKDVIMTSFREPTLSGDASITTRRERKRNPKEWQENVPFIAIKDNNSQQENCFNCFTAQEQNGIDGRVMVWNRGDGGMGSDILDGGTVV